MSAIADGPEEPTPVIQVLFALYPQCGAVEVTGPYEVLSQATQPGAGTGKTIPSQTQETIPHFPLHLLFW